MNDIEKNKRSAPKPKIIKELSLILNIDLDFLNDLAGSSKKTLPPDIIEYLIERCKTIHPNFCFKWNATIQSLCRAGASATLDAI